jgi:hypothetical protein
MVMANSLVVRMIVCAVAFVFSLALIGFDQCPAEMKCKIVSGEIGPKKDAWYIEVQKWKDSSYNAAPAEDRQKYDKLHRLLEYHELGHQKIAEDTMTEYNNKISQLTAKSEEEAKQKAVELVLEFDRVLKERQDAYEDVTDQGRKQPDSKPHTTKQIRIKPIEVDAWDFGKSYHGSHHFQREKTDLVTECK